MHDHDEQNERLKVFACWLEAGGLRCAAHDLRNLLGCSECDKSLVRTLDLDNERLRTIIAGHESATTVATVTDLPIVT